MTMPFDASGPNPFRRFWQLGYQRLVPIIPPDAPLHPESELAKRQARGERDVRGKVPGVLDGGTWRGLDLRKMEAQEGDLDIWHAWGASCGLRLGEGLIALDVDCLDPTLSRRIHDGATRILGASPSRTGMRPKHLMLYRTDGPTPYRQIRFEAGAGVGLVEVLSEGRQCVVAGIHPGTGRPYLWDPEPAKRAALPVITPALLDAFFAWCAEVLPAARQSGSSLAEAPDQDELRAPSPEALRATVDAIPNTSMLFPARDDYLRMAYALKAAAGDDEPAALGLFLDWCARWQDGTNDPEIAEADFDRAVGPYRVGYPWLRERAVGLFFGPPGVDASADYINDMFAHEDASAAERARRFTLLSDDDLQNRPDPRWLIARHIPEDGFGVLYGAPGTGKSFMALDWALHLATEKADWHGDEIAGGSGAVLYIAGEGAGDFKLRVQAWKAVHWELGRMIPASRFRVLIEPLNFMKAEDIGALLTAVKGAGMGHLSLIVVDTVSRAIAGADENKQQDMSLFVAACDALRMATGAFVLGIHHSSKTGDMRGSTAIPGGADAIFRFTREKGQAYGRLTCMKMKAGPDDIDEPYRLDRITLPSGLTSLVPVRVEDEEADSAICTPTLQHDILRAIQAAWDAKEPWSGGVNIKGRGAAFNISTRWDVPAHIAQAWIDMWTEDQPPLLTTDIVDLKSKRKGLRLTDAGHAVLSGVDGESKTDPFA